MGSGLWLFLACGWHGIAAAQFAVADDAGSDESACLALAAVALPELTALDSRWFETGPPEPGIAAALPPTLNRHCRVRGLIAPSIRFELWLPPAADWNGRFLGQGVDGFGGELPYERLALAMNQAYASAATDGGHGSGDRDWTGNDGLLRDFAYRALFEMSTKSAVLVSRFYGRAADYRYFSGCAQGGREGLMAAQRFPELYDGIVAGAPPAAFVDASLTQLWAARAAASLPGQQRLPPELLARVGDAAMAQCDAQDGVLDGTLEDPRRCNFDPQRLQCGISAGGRCLSAVEAAAVGAIYAGPRAVGANADALPGYAIGSETAWRFAAAPGPESLTLDFLRQALGADSRWDWRSFDFVADADHVRANRSWMLDATADDLSGLRDHGGRLIVYQGWNDVSHSPEATIDWYESVEAMHAGAPAGPAPARDFARLFMVPGIAGCAAGVEMQRAIEDWVERGMAPDRIEHGRDGEDGGRIRPLCPYPQVARYRGSGNTDRSGSFVCSN